LPYYEYECNKCGYKFEEAHSMSKIPKRVKCPKCGEKAVRKFSLLSFQWGKGMKELD